jgi:hypothetical protein
MNSLTTFCLFTENFLLRIESGNYVPMLCDETNIATKQQSVLTCRYVLATGQIVEQFWGCMPDALLLLGNSQSVASL